MSGADVKRAIMDKYAGGVDTTTIAEEIAPILRLDFGNALKTVINTIMEAQRRKR